MRSKIPYHPSRFRRFLCVVVVARSAAAPHHATASDGGAAFLEKLSLGVAKTRAYNEFWTPRGIIDRGKLAEPQLEDTAVEIKDIGARLGASAGRHLSRRGRQRDHHQESAALEFPADHFDIRDPHQGSGDRPRRGVAPRHLNDPPHEENANPAYWGPFSVVGEGAAR
jgi:hypothetical protein